MVGFSTKNSETFSITKVKINLFLDNYEFEDR